MKITRRQLRRIIKEAINEARPHSFGSEGYEMTAQAGADAKMYKAIVRVLTKSPEMGPQELVDTVNQMHPDLDAQDIHNFIDELEADGEILYDEAMEGWSLA